MNVEEYRDELGEVDWAEYNAAMEARMEELFEEWQELIDEAFREGSLILHPINEVVHDEEDSLIANSTSSTDLATKPIPPF